MTQVLTAFRRFAAENDGQDLLEYGLLAALIALVAMTGVSTLGRTISTVFWEVISRGF